MKFINYLESISGVSVYPMISMMLFLSVFAVVLYRTFAESKQSIQEQSQLPLNDH
ncbi:MAG: CcoQ/FixQ family Cbb3-type cytochrome c oxidase assembly chaperone [Flavobacteriales bacterium]|jgi:cytochrome c oxidase cbb3-type subunit IV